MIGNIKVLKELLKETLSDSERYQLTKQLEELKEEWQVKQGDPMSIDKDKLIAELKKQLEVHSIDSRKFDNNHPSSYHIDGQVDILETLLNKLKSGEFDKEGE